MSRRFTSTHAFTLIELLVVISIIALLISLLLPVLSSARQSASTSSCLSTSKQLSMSHAMYVIDSKGYGFTWGSSGVAQKELFWMDIILRNNYWESGEEIALCPEATTIPPNDRPYQGFGAAHLAWGNPAVLSGSYVDNYVGSYGWNGWLADTRIGGDWIYASGNRADFWSVIDEVPDATSTPVFGDSAWNVRAPRDTDGWNGNLEDPMDPYSGFQISGFTMNRHPGTTVNLAYLDGHAQTTPVGELWQQQWSKNFTLSEGPADLY